MPELNEFSSFTFFLGFFLHYFKLNLYIITSFPSPLSSSYLSHICPSSLPHSKKTDANENISQGFPRRPKKHLRDGALPTGHYPFLCPFHPLGWWISSILQSRAGHTRLHWTPTACQIAWHSKYNDEQVNTDQCRERNLQNHMCVFSRGLAQESWEKNWFLSWCWSPAEKINSSMDTQ